MYTKNVFCLHLLVEWPELIHQAAEDKLGRRNLALLMLTLSVDTDGTLVFFGSPEETIT